MFKYFIFLAVAVPAILGQDEFTPFVTGGRLALVGEFASDCSLNTPVQLHCQGILLDSRHVLTAAACVVNATNGYIVSPTLLRVTCGDNSLFVINSGREERAVSHVFPHTDFNVNTHANDLAVLRLAQEIPLPHNTIEEALLQDRIVAEGTSCTFSGWGAANNVSDFLNTEKRVVTAPIVHRLNCNTMANAGRIQEEMLCAGTLIGTGTPPVAEAVCRGNIGGGLYCNGRITGILSFGLGCGNINQPGVYMQPRFYRGWIQQQIDRTDSFSTAYVFPWVV